MPPPYRKQKTTAETFLGDRTRRRGDCPFCGSINTFSVSRISALLLWNCYSAACDIKGATGGVNLATMESYFSAPEAKEEKIIPFEIPKYWTAVIPPEGIKYLCSVNAIMAYKESWLDFFYCPRAKRVIFAKEIPTAIDTYSVATGRIEETKDTKHRPKWYRYDKNTVPLIVKERGWPGSKHAVIVEDAASACNIAKFSDGIALLGTNLSGTALDFCNLHKYTKVAICLDPDAKGKALKIAGELGVITDVSIFNLKKDPKEYEGKTLQKLLLPILDAAPPKAQEKLSLNKTWQAWKDANLGGGT